MCAGPWGESECPALCLMSQKASQSPPPSTGTKHVIDSNQVMLTCIQHLSAQQSAHNTTAQHPPSATWPSYSCPSSNHTQTPSGCTISCSTQPAPTCTHQQCVPDWRLQVHPRVHCILQHLKRPVQDDQLVFPVAAARLDALSACSDEGTVEVTVRVRHACCVA
jgi:hypothetical protein